MVSLITLSLYYGAAAVYLLRCSRQNQLDSLIMVTVLAIPFFGLFLGLMVQAARKGPIDSGDERFVDLVQGRKETRYIERVDIHKELNRVPIEEALEVEDVKMRRSLLLDVLKEDLDDGMIPLLQQAVYNDDSETSHYAVTAVMEIKRKLQQSIQKLAVEYENDRQNMKVVLEYARAVKRYIDSGFMDKRMHITHLSLYATLLTELMDAKLRSSELFREKIQTEIELQHYEAAMRDCELFLQEYGDHEDAYLSALNLYYILHKRDMFYETLDRMQSSGIPLSGKAVKNIRYWTDKGA